jgi:hypothetical protein
MTIVIDSELLAIAITHVMAIGFGTFFLIASYRERDVMPVCIILLVSGLIFLGFILIIDLVGLNVIQFTPLP